MFVLSSLVVCPCCTSFGIGLTVPAFALSGTTDPVTRLVHLGLPVGWYLRYRLAGQFRCLVIWVVVTGAVEHKLIMCCCLLGLDT